MLRQRSTPAILLALLLTLAGTTTASAQPKEFFFKDGDRIVVMGDSITEQLLYSNYVEMWTVSRFPKSKFTFRNVGIGGDTSPGGNNRFKRDVLSHKATALTVDFGMNDGRYTSFKEPIFKTYMKGLQGIANQAKAAKVRVAWVTPQPIERREAGKQLVGYNDTLEKFSAGVKEIADKNDGLFVDQFHPYLSVMEKARAKNPKVTVMGGDAVHPGPPGQSVMAASILKGLGFPRVVSRIEVNLKNKSKLEPKTVNCEASAELIPGGVSFKRKDHSLPYFPDDAKSILKWTPLLEDMNDCGVQVIGLSKGDYEILVSGKKVAQYTAEELEKGVNLAAPLLTSGPVADNVKKVWAAVRDKNRYFHDKVYRGVVLAGNNPKLYAERMKKMPELDAAVRTALDAAMATEYVMVIQPVKK